MEGGVDQIRIRSGFTTKESGRVPPPAAAAQRRRAQRRERSDREEILLQFANFEANKPNSTDCADSFEMHLQRDSGHNIALPAFLPTSRTSSVLFY